ncbi:MAG: DUF2075 domain-containing protein, partial [archaeon]|nr:DUF2075 domain-containing protein [archaeon]
MAIKLITGVPGAGKTYLALKLLTEQYYEWSKELQEYIRKDEFKNYTIITNIDELCLDTLDLTDVINQCNTNFETFFTKDFQEKVTKKHGSILYIIDEAQRHIGYYFRNKETLFYFDYHRHFDHEVWLITQHRYKINRNISTLAEMEYRAVKRSLAVFGEFKYNLMSDGEIFDRKIFKSDKKIFDIYKS